MELQVSRLENQRHYNRHVSGEHTRSLRRQDCAPGLSHGEAAALRQMSILSVCVCACFCCCCILYRTYNIKARIINFQTNSIGTVAGCKIPVSLPSLYDASKCYYPLRKCCGAMHSCPSSLMIFICRILNMEEKRRHRWRPQKPFAGVCGAFKWNDSI